MKFAVLAFVAGLCLVAVTANATGNFASVNEVDIDFISHELADDFMDAESYGAFSSIYLVMKNVLRSLKGVNCAIQGAVNMEHAAQKFINDVEACGGAVSQQVQNVITACKNVISTANDIVHVNSAVCNNGADDTVTDDTKKTGWSCFWKLLKKFMTLRKQIQNAIALIKKVPTIGTGANQCVNTALSNLSNTFTGFPSFVVSCSKLTNLKRD